MAAANYLFVLNKTIMLIRNHQQLEFIFIPLYTSKSEGIMTSNVIIEILFMHKGTIDRKRTESVFYEILFGIT